MGKASSHPIDFCLSLTLALTLFVLLSFLQVELLTEVPCKQSKVLLLGLLFIFTQKDVLIVSCVHKWRMANIAHFIHVCTHNA